MANVDVTRVAGNIGALNALTSLQNINTQLAVHQTRLATGKRLNEAADDPSGMNMALTFDIRRNDMKTVLSSIGDAKNLLATSEGGLKKISDILVKMKTKAMEAKGDTVSDKEREAIAGQLEAYADEIDDIVDATQWNGTGLIGGTGFAGSAGLNLLSGVTADGAGAATNFAFTKTAGFGRDDLGLDADYTSGSLLSAANIDDTIDNIVGAVDDIKVGIREVGTMSARLSFKEEAMQVAYNNTESAYNRIMNANMAEEQVEASKFTILQNTATAMLAQANAGPQFLLSLFR